MGCDTPLISEDVGKFLKYQLLLENLGVPMVSKSVDTHAYVSDNTSTLIVITYYLNGYIQ